MPCNCGGGRKFTQTQAQPAQVTQTAKVIARPVRKSSQPTTQATPVQGDFAPVGSSGT